MNANKIFFVIESSEEIMMKDKAQNMDCKHCRIQKCIIYYHASSFHFIKINLGIRLLNVICAKI